MADAEFILDLIIRARDDTAAAFASALGQAEAFNQALDDQEEKARTNRDAFVESAEKIKQSQAEVRREMEKVGAANRETLAAQREVEQQARRTAAAEADTNKTIRDRIKAHDDLNQSAKRLHAQLSENYKKEQQELAGIKNIERERVIAKQDVARAEAQLAKLEEDGVRRGRAAAQHDIDRARARQKEVEDLTKIGSAESNRLRALAESLAKEELRTRQLQEQERTLKKLEAAGKRYSDSIDSRKAAEFRKEIEQHHETLVRLGHDADSLQRTMDGIWDTRKVEQYRRAQESVRKEVDKTDQATRRMYDTALAKAREYTRQVDRLAQLERQRDAAATKGADTRGVREIDSQISRARLKLAELSAEVKVVSGQQIEINADLDTGAFVLSAATMEAIKTDLGRDINFNVDADVGAAIAKLEALRIAQQSSDRDLRNSTSLWSDWKREVQDAGNRVSTFDNFLRGMLSLGVALFLNQIVMLAGAAAGALTALAGSAIYAGGALGGGLVAGIAQALPVLGLLAAAIGRVAAVMKTVQQAQLLQQQESAKAGKTAKQTADATDAIASAQDGLAASSRRVADAVKGVSDARAKAIRQLQDLILQERAADLAAKGAVLSQEEAQVSLREALSSGDTGAVSRARLTVEQANLGVDQSQLASRRTSQDLATRRKQGVEGSPEVVQAKKSLDDARRSADAAQRSMDAAKRTAANTGVDALAAAGKLEFMKSQLSTSELALFNAMETLVNRWRKQSGKMVEPLIAAFTGGVERINKLLLNNKLIKSAQDLSSSMAKQFTRIFDHFTNNEGIKVFIDFANEARKNLAPLTDIFINLSDVFASVGKAASPAFRQLLQYFSELTRNLAEWTSSTHGQNVLADFFEEGITQVKAFMRAGGSVLKLIFDIINPDIGGGAKTGKNLLDDFTGAVTKLDNELRTSKGMKFMQDFFENSRKAISALRPVLSALAEGFARLFNDEGVGNLKAFASIMSDVLIPAFVDAIVWIGRVTRVVAAFLDLPLVGTLARIVIGWAALSLVLAKLHTAFIPVTASFRAIDKLFGGHIANLIAATGRWISFRAQLLATAAAEKMRQAMFALGNTVFVLRLRLLAMAAAQRVQMIATSLAAGAARLAAAGFWLLNAALLANPIGLIIIAIIALGAAFVLAYTKVKWFRDGVNAVLDFVKTHWKTILAIMTGPIGLAVKYILEHIGQIKAGFNSFIGFMSSLPGKIKGFATDAANVVVNAFKGIGEKILNGIMGGLKGGAGVAKAIANALISVIESAWNGTIGGKGIGPLKVPKLHLPRFETGGLLGGNYAEGDKYTVRVAGEEAILTPRQQAMIGKDKIMAVLRATGGKFLQPGGAYATGGVPVGFPVAGSRGAVVNADADTDGQASRWRKMWDEITASTRRNTAVVEARIRLMRVNITATTDRLYRDFSGRWQDIEDSAKRHATDLYRGVKGSIDALVDVIYKGMKYIGTATNSVLRTFDADPVSFSLDAPQNGGQRAAMGYFGNAGERGGDAIPIMVGRGEGIINWAHQKMIEPALQAMYGFGLHDLFRRTHAYHAGGPTDMGIPGFAEGGLTGPFGSGAAFNAVSNFAKKKFGMTMTAGRTNHGFNTSTGNVSDHSWGGAGDFSDGVLTPQEDAFNAFWKTKLPSVVKQLIWRGKDQLRGFPISDHEDHVHLALQRAFAFDNGKMARLISRAMRGLKISDLLGNVSGDTAQVDHIDPVKASGKRGPLLSLINKVLGKIRSKANSFIDAKFGQGSSSGDGTPMHGEKYDGPLNKTFPAHHLSDAAGHAQLTPQQVMDLAQKAGLPGRQFEQIAHGESSYYPGIISSDQGYGLWQMTPRVWGAGSPAMQAMNRLGGVGEMLNPWKNAQMAKFLYKAAGNTFQPWFGTRYLNAARGRMPGFARGGFAGGRAAVGLTPEMTRLRGIRRTAEYAAPDILPIDYEGVVREFNLAISAIRHAVSGHFKKVKKLTDRADLVSKDLTELTRDGGILAQMGTALERYGKIIAARFKESLFKVNRQGIVVRGLDPAAEAAKLVENSQSILHHQQAILKRVNDALKLSDTELGRVNRRIGQLEHIAKPTKAQKGELADLRTNREDIIGNQRDLRNRQLDLRQQIADQLEAIYNQQLEAFNKETDKGLANAGGASGGRLNEIAQRIANAFGQSTLDLQQSRIGIMEQQREFLKGRLAIAVKRGYSDQVQQISEQIDELGATIAEATAALLTASIEAVQTSASRRDAKLDLKGRILSALGQKGALQGLVDERIASINQQAVELQSLLPQAWATGNMAAAQQITDKIEELQTSVTELLIQSLTDRLADARAGFERTEAGLGFRERLNAVRERAGDRLGASRETTGVLGARRDFINQQRDSLLGFLGEAQAQGNEGLVTELTAALDELNVQLVENAQALKESIIATRQLSLNIITDRGGRETGLIATATDIISKLGALSGQQDTPTLVRFAQEMISSLHDTATDIISNIGETLGSGIFGSEATSILDDLRGAFSDSPQQFANRLVDLNGQIAALESTMGTTEREAFQQLIQAMIDNTGATLDAQQAILQLNGSLQPQTFSSTAWSWFREAIFTGMGDVLPQYSIPSFDGGGPVVRSGLARVHQGEWVAKKGEVSNFPTQEGDINITTYAVEGKPDTEYIASRVGYERRRSRASGGMMPQQQ